MNEMALDACGGGNDRRLIGRHDDCYAVIKGVVAVFVIHAE